jgi:hypothetical protein
MEVLEAIWSKQTGYMMVALDPERERIGEAFTEDDLGLIEKSLTVPPNGKILVEVLVVTLALQGSTELSPIDLLDLPLFTRDREDNTVLQSLVPSAGEITA